MATNGFAVHQNAPVSVNAGRMMPHAIGSIVLALSMVGLGIVGLVSGDFASVWQRIPIDDLPGRTLFAYGCAAIELAVGVGLFFRQSVALASSVLAIFFALWAVLLKGPGVVEAPRIEATWLGFAEITVMLAGAWMLVVSSVDETSRGLPKFLVGASGMRNARILFALSLIPIGLAHFFYSEQTAALVPSWLPWPLAWVYLTGAGSIATCIALLAGFWTRLAATMEAVMLTIITLLVWTPGLTPAPHGLQFQATGFLISAAIAGGAWVAADFYRSTRWSVRRPMGSTA